MEEYYQPEVLREALIIAGLKEIEVHGITDFSLRRVASACGVSCAAPYRHFKSKNDLILAIITYVNDQWSLLRDQILEVFKNDKRRCLIEICIANIRFWTANPHFRSIMLTDSKELDSDQLREKSRISGAADPLLIEYFKETGLSDAEAQKKLFIIRSVMYGAVQMLGNGESYNIDIIREFLEKELS
jgi:AcrR family transcriptional regulator